MKELLLNYTEYNLWANRQMEEILLSLNEEQANRALGGSFSTIRETAAHIWVAETIWLQRLQLAEQVIVPDKDIEGGLNAVCHHWLKTSEGLLLFTQKVQDDRGFEHTFHYHNIAGKHQKSKVWECVQHVCNHSTFHRGQLIAYFRQVGLTGISSTDYITFCRRR